MIHCCNKYIIADDMMPKVRYAAYVCRYIHRCKHFAYIHTYDYRTREVNIAEDSHDINQPLFNLFRFYEILISKISKTHNLNEMTRSNDVIISWKLGCSS